MERNHLTRNTGPDPCAKLIMYIVSQRTSYTAVIAEFPMQYLPGQIERRPLQCKRNTVPDRQIHRREETHREREVHDRAAQLQCIARPAIQQRCHDRHGVGDGRVRVDLGSGVSASAGISLCPRWAWWQHTDPDFPARGSYKTRYSHCK